MIQTALQAEHAQLQADGLAMQQQAAMAGVQPVPIILFTVEYGLSDGAITNVESTETDFL